jgi:hypothetical protein
MPTHHCPVQCVPAAVTFSAWKHTPDGMVRALETSPCRPPQAGVSAVQSRCQETRASLVSGLQLSSPLQRRDSVWSFGGTAEGWGGGGLALLADAHAAGEEPLAAAAAHTRLAAADALLPPGRARRRHARQRRGGLHLRGAAAQLRHQDAAAPLRPGPGARRLHQPLRCALSRVPPTLREHYLTSRGQEEGRAAATLSVACGGGRRREGQLLRCLSHVAGGGGGVHRVTGEKVARRIVTR